MENLGIQKELNRVSSTPRGFHKTDTAKKAMFFEIYSGLTSSTKEDSVVGTKLMPLRSPCLCGYGSTNDGNISLPISKGHRNSGEDSKLETEDTSGTPAVNSIGHRLSNAEEEEGKNLSNFHFLDMNFRSCNGFNFILWPKCE